MSIEYQVICDVPIVQKEIIVQNDDGGYTIFLRPDLDLASQREAFAHALRHITLNHFESNGSVQDIEREAHE